MSLLMIILKQTAQQFENNGSFINTKNEHSPSKGTNKTRNSGVNKRKRNPVNVIPKPINNKIDHLDSILLPEAREDVRRETISSINNSNEIFSNAMASVTE